MIERIFLRSQDGRHPLHIEPTPTLASGLVRRLAYCALMLGVPLTGLGLADRVRSVEPFIAESVAKLFVYSVVRNDPDRISRALKSAAFAQIDAAQVGKPR